jgi:trigger factor
VTFPEDYAADEVAGKEAVFSATVKEVKEKKLPELDDDFAGEAGGFDTLDELRADIESKLSSAEERAIDSEFREAVVDAVAEKAKLDLPHDLIHSKAHEMWHETAHRLQRQGVDPQRYLQIVNKTEEELAVEAEDEAERALRREAVLAAIVEAEGLEPTEEEVMEAVEAAAPSEQTSPKKLYERLKNAGRLEQLEDDLAQRKALDLVAESAKPISVEQAQARDKLWTPGGESAGSGEAAPELWTPGS